MATERIRVILGPLYISAVNSAQNRYINHPKSPQNQTKVTKLATWGNGVHGKRAGGQ